MRASIHAAFLIALSPALAGCASTLNAIFERSVADEDVYDHKVLTMTGERRIAIVVPRHSPNVICAESLPDAARASGARSALDIQAGGTGRPALGVDDQVQTALLQTFTRTETADVVRQLGWQVCNAYANRAIDYRMYSSLLVEIVGGANRVMQERAKAGTQVAAAGGTVQVNLGQPQPRRGAPASGSGTQQTAEEKKAAERATNPGTGTNTQQGGTNTGAGNPTPRASGR